MRCAPLLLVILAIALHTHCDAGGLLGDLVKGVGRATGIKPLEKAGQELDNAHRDIKDAIPPYKQIEESGSEFVRNRFLDMCNATYQTLTNSVIARCSNWDGRLDGQDRIQHAVSTLIDSGLFSRNEFSGVQIRWCPLTGAHGMAPDRGRVYLDVRGINDNPTNIAALLAHEMTHIRQYRSMGTDKFKCEYSRRFVECQGCQDHHHPLEREAYEYERTAYDKLQQQGWTMCNESTEEKVWIAYAYRSDAVWAIEGWREILRGQCSKLIPTIATRYLYYYAVGSEGGRWEGDTNLCLHPSSRFSRIADGSPCVGEFEPRRFKTVDTGESRAWSLRLVD